MKRIIGLILLIIMLFCLSITTVAVTNTGSGFTTERGIGVAIYVEGKMIGAGLIENNRSLVPVRTVAEKMGAEVIWVEAERKVIVNKPCEKMEYEGITYENVVASCELILGKAEIRIKLLKDGKEIFNVLNPIDCIADTKNGRTYIPARFVGYALGYDIEYKKLITGNNIYYKFIGKQIIDFDPNSDNTKKIDYDYDKEKYPDITVYNNIQYPSRKGYEDIVIVDATNGIFEGTKMINVFPYRWSYSNIIIECDDERYKIDENNTIEENLEIYSRFYTEKVGEKVVLDGNIYRPEFLTVESSSIFFQSGSTPFAFGSDYVDKSKSYYQINNIYSESDFSKMYYVFGENPLFGSGYNWYGWKTDEILQRANDKNTLMFLNTFLGETGQRLWKMFNDYYTMSGHSFVAPETQFKKEYLYEWEGEKFYMPDSLDGLSKEVVEKYGFIFVDNIELNGACNLLILNTGIQTIYIEYDTPNIVFQTCNPGYEIIFETIEK